MNARVEPARRPRLDPAELDDLGRDDGSGVCRRDGRTQPVGGVSRR